MRRIYLDYNASTPIDPAVAAAMRPFLEEHFGNPSSGHWASTRAKEALETARSQVAALLGCQNDEILFTSGGSEANNLALKGAFFKLREKGDHILTTRIEHPAIIEPCRFLERMGRGSRSLPVDSAGRAGPRRSRAGRSRHAPFSSASCTPTMRSAPSSRSRIAPELLTSMVFCFTPMRRNPSARFRPASTNSGLICLSIAGHKVYAPKGRRRPVRAPRRIARTIDSMVPGTKVAGAPAPRVHLLAVGLGRGLRACAATSTSMDRIALLARPFLEANCRNNLENRVVLNGHPTHRLPNTLNVSFVGRIGADILERLNGVAATTGSACHAGDV